MIRREEDVQTTFNWCGKLRSSTKKYHCRLTTCSSGLLLHLPSILFCFLSGAADPQELQDDSIPSPVTNISQYRLRWFFCSVIAHGESSCIWPFVVLLYIFIYNGRVSSSLAMGASHRVSYRQLSGRRAYQLAFLTPGRLPSNACILKLYCPMS